MRLLHMALLFFALLLACHGAALDEPPVWDAAMSVFPAAITLAEHGFDLGYLLAQPGYTASGPNTHAISPVTLLTALVYWLLGPRPEVVLPVLHLLHLGVAAIAFALLARIAQGLLGAAGGLALATVLLLHPLAQAQTATVYLEVPLLALTAAAVDAWIRDNPRRAALWAAAATLVKPSGAVAGGGLAVATLLFAGTPLRKRLADAGLLLVSAVLPVLVRIAFDRGRWDFSNSLVVSAIYTLAIPDVIAVIAVFLAVVAIRRPWLDTTLAPAARRTQLACACLTAAFFPFFVFLVLVGRALPLVPRYYLMVFPFAAIGLAGLLQRHLPRRAGALVLAGLALLVVSNRRGALYSQGGNNFALLERSLEYRDMLALQRLDLRQLERLPATLPVFYGRAQHFKLRYPAMGYARGPLANGHALDHEMPWAAGRLRDFPPSFFVLVEFPWLGEDVGLQVVQQAAADPRWRVRSTRLCVAGHCSMLFRVDAAAVTPSRTGGRRPPPPGRPARTPA